jgi:hypothetical protein
LASQVGRTIDLFDWSGVSPTGTFSVPDPHAWDLSKLYTTGEVTLLPTADFNGDGRIDGVDLAAWSANFGLNSGATISNGDANRDGAIDGADFLAWQRQLGATSSVSPTGRAVPEPATIALAGIGLLLCPGRCARRTIAPTK